MTLALDGLEVECIIGDLPDERIRPQKLLVDVELEVEASAAETDELADAVDYSALAEDIRTALVNAKCRMIERAAAVVHAVCMQRKSTSALVRSARVRVTKRGTVQGLGAASVVFP